MQAIRACVAATVRRDLKEPVAPVERSHDERVTYHLAGNHHKTCLKHSNFLNRKLCVQLLQHGTPWQQQGDREPKENQIRQNDLRQGSKHGNYNMHPRLIGRDPELRPVHQISGFHFTHGICLILPRLQILERAQTRRLLHWTELLWMERMSTQDAQTRGIKQIGKTLREERENNNMDHRTWINMNSRKLLETNDKWRMCQNSYTGSGHDYRVQRRATL